jgi:methyltransferase (TIGR00027 family)
MYDTQPLVLDDPVAVPILGKEFLPEVERTATKLHKPFSVSLRAFLVARSRYAEDCLGRAVSQGATQYVLLGAGLDTFAHRNPYSHLRVFEVDHPATQEWKRELLTANGIAGAANLVYAPVDFEHQQLATQLGTAGFDPRAITFFAWLGVVPYLTHGAFRSTLEFIAQAHASSGIVMDYGLPRSALPYLEQLAHDSLASRVELAGEPFRLFFIPEQMARELGSFHGIEDIGSTEINARYFSGRSDNLKVLGSAGRLVSAWL